MSVELLHSRYSEDAPLSGIILNGTPQVWRIDTCKILALRFSQE